ncbi:DUF397 domain-containing protein [Streptomyces sp. KR80]|uniref:DUF397 domain-containing protein n=1 Tax=Streptomyces sp. KR80 TaxID=3457426 RepID=UPI003FD3FDA3
MIDIHNISGVVWHKSTYSGENGGACIEIAVGLPGAVPVRDSKDPQGAALVFSTEAWSSFVAQVKADGFRPV